MSLRWLLLLTGLFSAAGARSQQRFNIGAQLTPAFTISRPESSNPQVQPSETVRVGAGAGLITNYYFNRHWLLQSFFNAYRTSYGFRFNDYQGYLADNSLFTDRLIYNNYAIGCLGGYKLGQQAGDKLFVFAGAAYAFNQLVREQQTIFHVANAATQSTTNIGYQVAPGGQVIRRFSGTLYAAVGLKVQSLIKTAGLFEYGVQLLIPVSTGLADQEFQNTIALKNGTMLTSTAVIRPRLYVAQLCVGFYIFNYDQDMRLFELRSRERGLGEYEAY